MAQIFNIEHYRTARLQSDPLACYCGAARAARRYFASQLEELNSTKAKPRILCLEGLEGGIPLVAGGWDLIYSASFFNSLPKTAACQVVKSAVSRLASCGRLLIAAVLPEAELERCPACRTAGSTRRDEIAMIQLTQDVPSAIVAGQLTARDIDGFNVYLELQKAAVVQNQLTPLRKVG